MTKHKIYNKKLSKYIKRKKHGFIFLIIRQEKSVVSNSYYSASFENKEI